MAQPANHRLLAFLGSVLFLGNVFGSALFAAEVLTTSKGIQQVARTNAATGLPVRIRGVVTFHYQPWRMLFIQDAFGGVYCDTAVMSGNPHLGTEVEVDGFSNPGSYKPIIIGSSLRELGPSPLPAARALEAEEFWSGRADGDRVRIRGYVVSRTLQKDANQNEQIYIRVGQHEVLVHLFGGHFRLETRAPYALIEVTGIACAQGDGDGGLQSMGVALQDPDHIQVIQPASVVLASARNLTQNDWLVQSWQTNSLPVRFRGVVTLATSNEVWMSTGDFGLSVSVEPEDRLGVTDSVEAVGFLKPNGQGMKLEPASVIQREPGLFFPSLAVDYPGLTERTNFGKRVRVTGEFMHRIPSSEGDLLVLRNSDRFFEVSMKHPRHIQTVESLAAGARVQAVGVLWQQSSGVEGTVAPRVLVGSPADFKVLTPSPWPLNRTLAVVTTLLAALGFGLIALAAAHQRLRQTHRKLALTERELLSLNHDLEDRIKARTAELQRANDKLKTEVHERRQAEEALLDRETRLRDAQRLSHLGSFHWNAKTNHISWSEELHQVYGRDPASFHPTFQAYLDQIHPADRARVEQSIYSAFNHGSAMAHDYRILRPNGQVRWVSARARVILDAKGEPCGMEGTCQDITDRKRAEELLAEGEKRFRLLVEGTEVIVWEFDLASGNFTYISPQARRLGYPLEDWLKPQFWENHLHPEDRDEAIRFCQEKTRLGLNHRFQYRMLTASGGHVWFDDVVSVETSPEGQGHMRGVMIDITERKQAEAVQAQLESRLRQAHKMEAIGTLAGGIAHDFNNILGSIIGYTQLALQDAHDHPELREHLSLSLKASHRARDLVHQILTFSRPQAPESKTVRVKELIEETVKLLRATVPATTEIEIITPDDLPDIGADPSLLQQVLMNLAANAVHAMKESEAPRLRLEAKATEVTPSFASLHPGLAPGPHVEIVVSDNGCGIPAESLPRIFDPFFTTKAPGEGTGLGLSMVHGIIKRHHGGIRVQSQPGEGTAFHLYLPVQKGATTSTPKPRAPKHWPNTPRVLFVDDETSLCQVGKRLLERAGCQVTVQTSAQEALEYLRQRDAAVDLVITDLSMPGLSGLDLIRELRILRPATPVILTTGHADPAANAEARGLGVVEILLKPNDAESLLQSVHRALQKSAASPSASTTVTA